MPKLEEGVDFYMEGGLMVLTEHFLLKRGYCCGSGCRHCPYGGPAGQEKEGAGQQQESAAAGASDKK